MKTVALLALLLADAALAPSEKHAIDHLLAFVAASDCTFIRNGDAHSAEDARTHMQRKYEHFEDKIDSAERFIELAASRSTLSGKPYHVDCPGDERRTSAEWLLQELARYRAFNSAQAVPPTVSPSTRKVG